MIPKSQLISIKLKTIVIFLIAFGSISCNLINSKTPETDPSIVLTQVAINVSTQLTLTAASNHQSITPVVSQIIPTSTTEILATLTPPSITSSDALASPEVIEGTMSLDPQVTPSLTVTSQPVECVYRANLEYTNTNDLDKYPLKKEFSKVWRLKNTGTCDWSINYEFFYVRGDLIGAKITSPLTKVTVPPNGYADVKINFKTPNKPGFYTGYWMIRGDGHVFGVGSKGNQLLWITIEAYQKKP